MSEEEVLPLPISPQLVPSSVRSSVSEHTADSDDSDDSGVRCTRPPPLSIGQASSNMNTADTLGWAIELQYEVLTLISTPQHTPRCDFASCSQPGSENVELYSMSKPRSPRRRPGGALPASPPPQAGTPVVEPDASHLQAEIQDLEARYQQLDRETRAENRALRARLEEEQEQAARDACDLAALVLARSHAEDLQAKCGRLERECQATRVELEAERIAHLEARAALEAERRARQEANALEPPLASRAAISAHAGSHHEPLPTGPGNTSYASFFPDVSTVLLETAPVPSALVAEDLAAGHAGFWHRLFGAFAPEPGGAVAPAEPGVLELFEDGVSEASAGPSHAEERSVGVGPQPAVLAPASPHEGSSEGLSGILLCSRSLGHRLERER